MTVGQALLESASVTGRVTVLLAFGFIAHLARFGLLGRGDSAVTRRSLPGFLLTLVLGAAAPLSVWRRWGALGPGLPAGLVAALAAVGTVVTLGALMFLLLSAF